MAWATPAAGLTWEPTFRAASERFGLPAGLLSRVAWQESRYDPAAYNSSSGATGMMQIIPRFHPGVDPWAPGEAIPYAARYLREMFDRFGTWALALAAYNAGPGAVDDAGGKVPAYPETVAYVHDILRDVGLPGGSGAGILAGAAALALLVALLGR